MVLTFENTTRIVRHSKVGRGEAPQRNSAALEIFKLFPTKTSAVEGHQGFDGSAYLKNSIIKIIIKNFCNMLIELNKQYEFAGQSDYKIDSVISSNEQVTMVTPEENVNGYILVPASLTKKANSFKQPK